MKVAFVSAFPVFAHLGGGGAEMSDYSMLAAGFRRGHRIQQLLDPLAAPPGAFDAVILSNYRSVQGEPLWALPKLVEAARRAPTVVYNHDIPMCHHQLWYPGAERCLTCPNKDATQSLLEAAALNIFLSPLHVERLAETQPWIRDLPQFLTPSPVDVGHYRDRQSIRVPGTAFGVNSLSHLKGGKAVMKYVAEHPEMQFTFVGESHYGREEIPAHVTYMGPRTPDEMPGLFSQSEAFIHLPPSLDPYSRSTIEARLCGIKRFIVNGNIGALSYPEWKLPDDEFRAWIAAAPTRFWEAIEKAVA